MVTGLEAHGPRALNTPLLVADLAGVSLGDGLLAGLAGVDELLSDGALLVLVWSTGFPSEHGAFQSIPGVSLDRQLVLTEWGGLAGVVHEIPTTTGIVTGTGTGSVTILLGRVGGLGL